MYIFISFYGEGFVESHRVSTFVRINEVKYMSVHY